MNRAWPQSEHDSPPTQNELEAAIVAVYRGPLDEFVSRRDALIKQLRRFTVTAALLGFGPIGRMFGLVRWRHSLRALVSAFPSRSAPSYRSPR
jgi:hypothetical protein